jgi:hypothetical protein
VVFLFRDRSDINILFIIVLSFALHFHNWMSPPLVIANESDGFLANLLLEYIKPLPGIVLIFLFQLLVISQALRLNILLSLLTSICIYFIDCYISLLGCDQLRVSGEFINHLDSI